MSTLTPKAFELWIYFSKNRDNHFFWLSKVDFLQWSNIRSTSYYEAFNELKEKGYLIGKKEDSNKYDFYEDSTSDSLQQSPLPSSQRSSARVRVSSKFFVQINDKLRISWIILIVCVTCEKSSNFWNVHILFVYLSRHANLASLYYSTEISELSAIAASSVLIREAAIVAC